ncbi:MAG: Na+/H+ antiporter NhaC family protein [Flavobacteriales bacterium]|nr:Na+/H+ antiporter NhaC family protein [Flavobacteriales bacterium]
MNRIFKKNSVWSLLPLAVFFVTYMVTSIIVGDFYKMPITVAFVLAVAVSIIMTTDLSLNKRVELFSRSASDKNIMLMIWIFILAGAFATSAKAMGAVDATVELTMCILPSNMLLSGLFVAACFISFSVGTSVGTIVALVPIASGICAATGLDVGYVVGIIVGGAFFGDNLSFISDTTIAATQTQGCLMKDKFRVNSMIVAPCAVLLLALYIFQGADITYVHQAEDVQWIKVLPYVSVILLALCGVNVMVVLIIGIILCGVIGLAVSSFGIWDYLSSMGEGIDGMGQLIIVTLMAGGMLGMIRYNGGIDYLIDKLTRKVNTARMGELSIAALVCLANVCTANNTIAIITTGDIARDISSRFGIDPRKTASIMDTFSCFVQGILPYGAQLLMASQLSGVTPLDIIPNLYYPFMIGLAGILAIIFRYPARYSRVVSR